MNLMRSTNIKNLFLSSAFANVANFLPDFLDGVNSNHQWRRVAFIDIASQIEDYKGYIDDAKKAFGDLGFKIHLIDFNQSTDGICHQINSCDMIYVSGGNTPYLLWQLKSKQLDKFLIDWIYQGKPYIGESAGSVILAKSIEYILPMENQTEKFTDFIGLDLIDFFPLVHFGNQPFVQETKIIFDNHVANDKLIAFSNQQAIFVYGNKMLLRS